MKTPNQNTLNKAATALLKPNAVEHKRPKEPTKADLNKKFVMEKTYQPLKKCDWSVKLNG